MSAGILTTVSKDTLDVSEEEAEIRGNVQWVCFKSMNESQRWGGSAVDTMNTVSWTQVHDDQHHTDGFDKSCAH